MPFPPIGPRATGPAGYWTGRTVDSMLSEAAQRWPTRVAVLDADDGPAQPQRLSFARLDERADRAAAGLAALGIAPRRSGAVATAERL